MQSREDGKLVSGRCYCGLSAGAYSNKVKGQSEVERSTLTPRKAHPVRGIDKGGQRVRWALGNKWRNRKVNEGKNGKLMVTAPH